MLGQRTKYFKKCLFIFSELKYVNKGGLVIRDKQKSSNKSL